MAWVDVELGKVKALGKARTLAASPPDTHETWSVQPGSQIGGRIPSMDPRVFGFRNHRVGEQAGRVKGGACAAECKGEVGRVGGWGCVLPGPDPSVCCCQILPPLAPLPSLSERPPCDGMHQRDLSLECISVANLWKAPAWRVSSRQLGRWRCVTGETGHGSRRFLFFDGHERNFRGGNAGTEQTISRPIDDATGQPHESHLASRQARVENRIKRGSGGPKIRRADRRECERGGSWGRATEI